MIVLFNFFVNVDIWTKLFWNPYTVAIISSFVYVIVMFYSIIKRDIPDTNTGYKLNIY